jgi:chloride channel protein, CIC family
VSGSYAIVLPVMISNMVAYVVSRQYQRDSIFDVVARQDGMELPSMEHRREAVIRRVEDAMRLPPVVLPREFEIADAVRLADEGAAADLLAHVRPQAWVLIGTESLRRLVQDGKGTLTIGQTYGFATPLPIVHPDEPLDAALAALGDAPLLPVVHRAEPGRLVGVVSLEDILATYRLGRDTSEGPAGPGAERRV